MMFTVLLDNHSTNLQRLLDLYVGRGSKVIDFTYGTGALWQDVQGYEVTKCDANASDGVKEKDIFADDYADLGKHKAGIFDPPYLIGRSSFDYSAKVNGDGALVPMQYQGKRSWGTKGVGTYTSNQTVDKFNERVRHINNKAPTTLEPEGMLFVKVLDPRHNKRLVQHHINVVNILTNFTLDCVFVYIRQGATTWKVKGTGQNLHGYWLAFRLK